MTWEEIKKANETIKTTNIKGKDYAEVNQRIKAFRMVYPMGTIRTEMIQDDGERCTFRAEVGVGDTILASGTAYERQNASQINRTSYIENCETSAVGRALGMAGFGIDTSVASAEEVTNAIKQQEAAETRPASQKQVEILATVYTGDNLARLLSANKITTLEEISMAKASELIERLHKAKKQKEAKAE